MSNDPEERLIKHIVMWNVRGDTADEKREAVAFLKSRFEALVGVVPGLLTLEIGVDSSRVDYACDVVLYSEFESQACLDAYATHPEHTRIRAELGNTRTARYQVDYTSNASRSRSRAPAAAINAPAHSAES